MANPHGGRWSFPCPSRPHCCSRSAARTEPSSPSGVKDVDIELLKQQQVRPRPCPSTALRSPPLQLPPQASHITCVSVVPTLREHPGCSQVLWRLQRCRYTILYDRLQRLAGVRTHRHSPAPPASTTALRPARVLSGARCSSNIMRKMSQENFWAAAWSTRSCRTLPPWARQAVVERRRSSGRWAAHRPEHTRWRRPSRLRGPVDRWLARFCIV